MILEIDSSRELQLPDALWSPNQARKLKAIILAGGSALQSALAGAGGGMDEETAQAILDKLEEINVAVRSDRSIIEVGEHGLAKSVMDSPL